MMNELYSVVVNDGLADVLVPDHDVPQLLETFRREARSFLSDFWPSEEEWLLANRVSKLGFMLRKDRAFRNLTRAELRFLADIVDSYELRHLVNDSIDSVLELSIEPDAINPCLKSIQLVMSE